MARLPLLFVALNALVAATSALEGASPKKVMIWVANPFNQTKLDAMIANLKVHRKSFTGIAYQFFAVCGAGSDDVGGSNDCSKEDATGEPHLAPGHPIHVPADLGQQLKKALGPSVELWPVISYGNPGNASVLDRMLTNPTLAAKFAEDAIKIGHAQGLTGYNIDFEASGSIPWASHVETFLDGFARALHSATPPIGVTYDCGNTPPAGPSIAPLDRWISMSTYTSSLPSFQSGLVQGLAASGEKFGVGLCPSCDKLNPAGVEARFDAISRIGKGKFRELDIWAYGDWPDYWWNAFEKWLSNAELSAPDMQV